MKLRLTKAGRVVIFVLIVAILGAGGFFGYQYLSERNPDMFDSSKREDRGKAVTQIKTDPGAATATSGQTAPVHTDANDPTINLSLDEWIGWKPIIDANGGLETQAGSIFDKLGIKVSLNIINDAEASSNALIKGSLNAAGYTTNRVAFLSGKFREAGLDVVMPVFTNYSDGGDGIIAMNGIDSIEDLVGAKVGVPKFSEAQTLVVWFVNKSDLPDTTKREIIDNMILMDDAEATGQAFFAGKLDVAATWQPFLSNAADSTNSHILFSTASSNKLIMDGIVFRSDFVEAHPDVISKFADGIFQAADTMYKTEFDALRSVMPMFADASDEDILAQCGDAGMMGYAQNVSALENDCPVVYSDMCDIWESIGETVDRNLGATLFDTSYVKALSDHYTETSGKVVSEITQEQRDIAKEAAALLSKSATVNFVGDTAKFVDAAEANAVLHEFVEIANTLDGTIIQIEGNINAAANSEGGMKLSEERAKTVRNYLIANGIDANRIIVVGNGNSKMVTAPNAPDAERNRRTDIFFKTIES